MTVYINGVTAAADFPMKMKPALARYVMPGWYISSTATRVIPINKIYYTPIFVEETTTYIRILIQVQAFAAGNADLRIFNWDNGVPGALVLSAGTVSTGTNGVKEITISQELTRGYYFLAIRCDATPTLIGPDFEKALSPPLAGLSTGWTFVKYMTCLSESAAYSDPAGAPTSGETVIHAFVYLREN